MSEYISRDAIHTKIEKEVERYFDDPAPADGYYLVEDVLSEIENFTAADVAPVVHSYWIPVCGYRKDNPCGGECDECGDCLDNFMDWPNDCALKRYGGVLCRCGNCNEVTLIPDKGALYCSQCGAKMDMETP